MSYYKNKQTNRTVLKKIRHKKIHTSCLVAFVDFFISPTSLAVDINTPLGLKGCFQLGPLGDSWTGRMRQV